MNFLKFSAILILFILIFSYGLWEIYDLDTWLHLKTGEYIIKNKTIPRQDIFSYTVSGKPWINHEWLSQAIFYSIYDKLGPNGLIVFRAFLVTCAFLILFLTGYRKENYIIAIPLLLAVLFVSEQRFQIRPELFTLLFTSAFLLILNNYRSTKLLYLLPPIQLLWVNMHGYFLVGILLVAVYTAAETLKRRYTLPFGWRGKDTLSGSQYKRLLVVGFLIIIASFINPYGWRGFIYPFTVLFKFIGYYTFILNSITELSPLVSEYKIRLPYLVIPWFKIIIIVSALSFFMNFRKLDIGNLALYLLFILVALKTRRNIALFSAVAYVTAVSNINDIKRASLEITGFERIEKAIKAFLLVLLIIFMSVLIFESFTDEHYSFEKGKFKKYCFGVSSASYPEKAVSFIEKNHIMGNLLNDFNSGAYLIWRLFPEKRVFIDGRTEIYDPGFYELYNRIFAEKTKMMEVISKYDINCVLLSYILDMAIPETTLKFLYEDKNWTLVYLDNLASVFVKNTEENKSIIDRFAVRKSEPRYELTQADFEELKRRNVYPYAMLKKAYILSKLGLYDQALKEVEYGLRIKPDCVIAYQIAAFSCIGRKDYARALKYLRKGLVYDPRNINLYHLLEKVCAAEPR